MGKRNRGMSAMINEAAKRLMAGEEGSDVVGFLRAELAVSAERGGRPQIGIHAIGVWPRREGNVQTA